MARKIIEWEKKCDGVRCRGKRQSIEVYVKIEGHPGWWEIIKNVRPTKTNCEEWSDRRDNFQAAAAKGVVNYIQYFPNGNHGKLVAHLKGDDMTINQWFDKYIEYMEAPKKIPLSTNTIHGNKKIINNQLRGAFGHRYLSQLTFKEVSDWVRLKKIVGKTIENKLRPLRWCYDMAYRTCKIDGNIFARGYPVETKESEHEKDAFTPAECQLILESTMPEYIKNMVTFWLFTGLRSGEIYGLKWSKWDKTDNTILINEVRRLEKQEDGAKTSMGIRKFELTPQAVKALQQQERLTKMCSLDDSENLIFLNGKNTAWTYNFWRQWKKELNKLGIRYREPYTLRHSFATMTLGYQGDEYISKLSFILGHEEIKTTKKSYVDYELVNEDWNLIYQWIA